MKLSNDKNKEVAHHVFNGSTTMVGVCVTIIALFRVMKAGEHTLADEILGVDTFIFILSTLFSYTALRGENKHKAERIADVLFIAGITIMLAVGIIILYTTY